jgi:putative ABC transport system permease protein
MQTVIQDMRYELRQLLKKPGFTAVAILTFALGAGANALMFTVIDSVLLRPLPFPDAGRLVSLQTVQGQETRGSVSFANFQDWRAQSRSFQALSAYTERSVSLRLPHGEPVHAGAVASTGNLLDVLQVRPMLGPGFPSDVDRRESSCPVLISFNFWRERFAGNSNAIGQHLAVDGVACTVAGVMPAGFAFPKTDVELWLPLRVSEQLADRGADFLSVIGRLTSTATLPSARRELDAIAKRLQIAYPDDNKNQTIFAESYHDSVTGNARPALLALLGAVGLRALGRKREMAIRAALGAGRMRIARQLFTENLLLAVTGTAAGLALAALSLGLLKRLAAGAIPRIDEVDLHAEVCLFMFGLAAVSALLFGLVPVIQAARQDIETALRENAQSSGAPRSQLAIRDALVVGQLALAVMLLAGSGLLLRALHQLLQQDRGFTSAHVLTLQTALSGAEPEKADLAAAIYGPELDRIKRIPGVESAGFVSFLPLSNGHASASFKIIGRTVPASQRGPFAALNASSEDYFRALQIPLLQGRFFNQADTLKTPRVAIVNNVLVQRYFAGENPIGKQVSFEDPDTEKNPITIVGVVQGSRQIQLEKLAEPEIYLNFRQAPPGTLWSQFLLKQIMTYVVRTTADPAAISAQVQKEIHKVDPAQTIFHVASMEQIVSSSVHGRRLGAILLSVFAGLALAVAAAGLYGVLSYMVSQRTRDIALRMALGARRDEVVRMIVSRALVLYAIGLVVGVLGAVWCGHVLANVLTAVPAWDPAALGLTGAVLVLVTVFAAWFPARRASSIDPYQALRSE